MTIRYIDAKLRANVSVWDAFVGMNAQSSSLSRTCEMLGCLQGGW